MTHKELAERLRDMVRSTDMIVAETREEHPPMLSVVPREVLALADELDPPRPEPGTVVWVKWNKSEWQLAMVSDVGDGVTFYDGSYLPWPNIHEYKPARILAPGEVAVTIPPVSGWPIDADSLSLRYSWPNDPSDYANVTITREEAERMEADQ